MCGICALIEYICVIPGNALTSSALKVSVLTICGIVLYSLVAHVLSP